MDELLERLARLEPLREKARVEFDRDPYLRDIVERNLEVAAQCVLDISHRIISLTQSPKPVDYYGAILQLGELNVLPPDFARQLAPLAGFHNILVHEYLEVDWGEVHGRLQQLADLARFADFVREWLVKRQGAVK